jgi:hypothetical protein
MNKQLEKIIKEELKKLLKENPLDPMDTEGHINQAKIEMVLKKLNKNAFNHPSAKDQSLYETDRRSWIMGYQKALKEVAEELLGLLF